MRTYTVNYQNALDRLRAYRKQQKLQKVTLFSSTLTHNQCDVGNITFCNFLLCMSLNVAVNKCRPINLYFVHLF